MVASAKSDLSLPANNVPVIANGYVGTNPVDGAMYMAGVFNGYSSKTPSHRAALPSTVALAVTGPAPVTAGASALDFERATFYRRSTVQNGSVTVHVEQRWFAHRQHRSLLVTDFRAWVDPGTPLPPAGQFGVTLSLSSRAAPSKDVQLHPLPVPAGSPFDAYNGSTMVAETNTSGLTVVAYATTAAASHVSFPSNNSLVTFVTAVRSSLDSATADDVVSDAIADFTAGAAMAANGTLWSSHVQKWATSLWTSGIELTPAAPQYVGLPAAVNMSVFSILSSVREDWPYGLSPGGLTPGYNGHSFWDVETWMYPPIALLYPAVASSLLEYRYARIPGAEEKARSYAGMNYHGAMFPWESAFTGEEVCPSWAATGLREIHISGDIAFAVSQYWKLTNDLVWLRTRGRPLLSGIADFWSSKVQPNPAGGLSINNTIPPDEYEDHTLNDVYTNSVAKLALYAAAAADRTLGLPPSSYTKWTSIADQIVVLYDPATGVHPEFEGYKGQTIKQADVILLGFPLEVPFGNNSATVRRNDLLYYGNRTDPNGPAMTWAMQCVGLLELGDTGNAAANFVRAYANQQQPFLVWSETPTGGTPNFITGAGGFLQAVLFGYPGTRIRDTGLFFNPQLMPNVTAVTLRGVGYLGNRVSVSYDADTVQVQLLPGAGVVVGDRAHDVRSVEVLVVATGAVMPLSAASPAVSVSVSTLASKGMLLRATSTLPTKW